MKISRVRKNKQFAFWCDLRAPQPAWGKKQKPVPHREIDATMELLPVDGLSGVLRPQKRAAHCLDATQDISFSVTDVNEAAPQEVPAPEAAI